VVGPFQAILGHLQGFKGVKVQQTTEGLNARAMEVLKSGITGVISTSVGEGPIRTTESLIDENGEPIKK
jgi:diphosphomevalonate decarboxylase